MKITYYAWIRQKTSCSQEILDTSPPSSLEDLITLLQKRGEPWHEIFKQTQSLRFSVNGTLVYDLQHPLSPHDNLSIFPPFTGG